MSAELMNSNSSVRCSSSVRVALISYPNARISFKFLAVASTGPSLGFFFFNFWISFFYLTNIFHFPYSHGTLWEPKLQKTIPRTNHSQKWSTFPQFAFQWSSQNYAWHFGICEKIAILILFFFRFR